jgi:hypothetical protein
MKWHLLVEDDELRGTHSKTIEADTKEEAIVKAEKLYGRGLIDMVSEEEMKERHAGQ